MTPNISKFTVRIDAKTLKKFHYVANYNARSANKELEVLIKRHIAKFEKTHGDIVLQSN